MLTIFSCPKLFTDPHINIIQRNAIKSWTLLKPRLEIILIGDEEGVAEVCKEFGLHHIPEVERNEFGTPQVSSILNKAQSIASNKIVCYVNTDIILMSDFLQAVQRVTHCMSRFLLVGRRWDIDINQLLDFETDWEIDLKDRLKQLGRLHSHTGIDYFVFPKGLYKDIPPFAIGRTVWDNWLIYWASSQRIPVIDATSVVTVVH